jgi:hypothetical protein
MPNASCRLRDANSVSLLVPNEFIVPPPRPPPLPLMPGTVSAADFAAPTDPALPFLEPWSAHRARPRGIACAPIPCDVNGGVVAAGHARHDTEATLQAVFKDRADRDAVVADVLLSLANPFKSNASSIVWSVAPRVQDDPRGGCGGCGDGGARRRGGKKLVHRHHRLLTGAPWSVAAFGDAAVRRNMVYNGDGDAIAQVDFDHGAPHAHALVLNNLEHTPGGAADHMFPLHAVPWAWLCLPLHDEGLCATPATDSRVGGAAEQWTPVTLPFEDFMGAAMSSDDM